MLKMTAPTLTIGQIQQLVKEASNIQPLDRGGQKIVFTGIIDGKKYALKFMSPNPQHAADPGEEPLDDVTARAQREVETMQQCSTPHLVRMGPIGLRAEEIDGQSIIFFSEEFIDGKNLQRYLKDTGPLSIDELLRLATHISEAINALWQFSKIHRDIKPGNIMRRDLNGEFVLLDMGLVLDLQDASLSMFPMGTPLYFSPEQMDFSNRRTVMNFRSDLFSLGIVLYEMSTGKHPFLDASATTTWEVIQNINKMDAAPPLSIRRDLPSGLNDIIIRLLAKRPALRYRSISLFQQALQNVESEGYGR
jgi:eukaryotic-like serine/threonine-protein kinase